MNNRLTFRIWTFLALCSLLSGLAATPVVSVYATNQDSPGAGPASVTIGEFIALPAAGETLIRWTTLQEVRTVGYNLHRATSQDGEKLLLTPAPVPANIGGMGGEYEVLDPDTKFEMTYYYWIEAIGADGSRTYGPYLITGSGVFLPNILKND